MASKTSTAIYASAGFAIILVGAIAWALISNKITKPISTSYDSGATETDSLLFKPKSTRCCDTLRHWRDERSLTREAAAQDIEAGPDTVIQEEAPRRSCNLIRAIQSCWTRRRLAAGADHKVQDREGLPNDGYPPGPVLL